MPGVERKEKDSNQDYGGEGGIRTPDTLSGMAAFEAARFNRSRTSPRRLHFSRQHSAFGQCLLKASVLISILAAVEYRAIHFPESQHPHSDERAGVSRYDVT